MCCYDTFRLIKHRLANHALCLDFDDTLQEMNCISSGWMRVLITSMKAFIHITILLLLVLYCNGDFFCSLYHFYQSLWRFLTPSHNASKNAFPPSCSFPPVYIEAQPLFDPLLPWCSVIIRIERSFWVSACTWYLKSLSIRCGYDFYTS